MNEPVSISLANLRPLDDRILLLRLPDISSGSALIIPDIAQTPSHRGKVERIGPGKWMKDEGWRRPLAVTLNDVVHYQSCDVDDGTHVLISEADILGVESA